MIYVNMVSKPTTMPPNHKWIK